MAAGGDESAWLALLQMGGMNPVTGEWGAGSADGCEWGWGGDRGGLCVVGLAV